MSIKSWQDGLFRGAINMTVLGALLLAFVYFILPGPDPEAPTDRQAIAAIQEKMAELERRLGALERWKGSVEETKHVARQVGPAAALQIAIHLATLERENQDIDLEAGIVTDLIAAESSWRRDATSPKGAIGLMQIMPGTARAYRKKIEPKDLMDPVENVRIGTEHLIGLRRRLGSWGLAMAAYNAGEYAPAIIYATKIARAYDDPDGKTEGIR